MFIRASKLSLLLTDSNIFFETLADSLSLSSFVAGMIEISGFIFESLEYLISNIGAIWLKTSLSCQKNCLSFYSIPP